MALRLFGVLLIVVQVAGCGPQVALEDLPPLAPVATGEFLETVQSQLESLASAVADDPLDAKKTGQLGMAYLAYRLDSAAEIAFRRAHMLQPQKFEWTYYHAEALTRLGGLDEAAMLLQQAVARKPGYVPARLNLGKLHMQLGDFENSESNLQSVLDDEPDNHEARLALARLYLRADQPEKALGHLNRLIDKASPAGSVYFAMADVSRRLGEPEKAAEYSALFEKYRGVSLPTDDRLMREVIELDLSERPLLRMAQTLNQQGRTEQAMKLLHLALERNPNSDLTHAALVGAYGAMKQFKKVDEHYRLALEAAPPTAPLLRNLGRARFYEGRFTEARQALEQTLELNPHDANAMAWLGLVHLQQKDIEGSLALLTQALEENPGETLARHNVVSILHSQERHEEAVGHMQQLLVVEDKLSPRVWRKLGESYLFLGRNTEARDAFGAAIASAERFNDDAEATRSASALRNMPQ